MGCIEYEKYKELNKIFEEKEHQKKVIDRLSRKIQHLKGKKRIIDGAYIVANKYLNRYYTVKRENDFLRERENKLQLIEQMFKSGTVDLKELNKIVMKEGEE